MKILTFSSLYPNAARPNYGIFVETRLRHRVASGEVESRVVAPYTVVIEPQDSHAIRCKMTYKQRELTVAA